LKGSVLLIFAVLEDLACVFACFDALFGRTVSCIITVYRKWSTWWWSFCYHILSQNAGRNASLSTLYGRMEYVSDKDGYSGRLVTTAICVITF